MKMKKRMQMNLPQFLWVVVDRTLSRENIVAVCL